MAKKLIAMAARDLNEKKLSFPCYAEIKYDGVRVLTKVGLNGNIEFFFKSGNEVFAIDHLRKPISLILPTPFEYWLDGEVVHDDGFNSCVGDIKNQSIQAPHLKYRVFDIFSKVLPNELYLDRKERLKSYLIPTRNTEVTPTLTSGPFKDLKGLYDFKKLTENAPNSEGIMIKQNGLYVVGNKSHDWMRVKDKLSVDFPVVDYYEGKDGFTGLLGGFVVENPKTGVRTRVGSGLTKALRAEYIKNPKSYIGQTLEVEYQYVTDKGSLRHPVFKGFRIDK